MSNEVKPITIKMINNKQLPLILNKKIIWKKKLVPFDGNVKLVKPLNIQEDVIFDSKSGGEFTCGDVQELTIVNRLNKTSNTCRTIARCKSVCGTVYEKTSDEVTKLIGQHNYDTLFSTLCSVINQELKIRGIFSLLTVPKASSSVACQASAPNYRRNITETNCCVENQCQTDESFISIYKKKIKMRTRSKRSLLAPYVIPEAPDAKKPKRVIIEPHKFGKLLQNTESIKDDESHKGQIPDLGASKIFEQDSNSNDSVGSKYSMLSINTTSDLLFNPLKMLDKVIEPMPEIKNKDEDYKLHNLDSPKDTLYPNGKPNMPLDQVLRSIPQEQRIKVLLRQGISDWQNCLVRDESGHLPIHVAVLNNDLDLLKRQCLVLKMRNIPVDIPADNLSPLRMSLYQDNVAMTALLLQHNADPLDSDDRDQTCFHITAEKDSEHLQALVNYCQHNARKILEENEDLWKPEYSTKTNEELAKILMSHISKLYDTNGYTPLMLASKAGRYENIKLLVEACPESVNTRMTNSGNTPLFLAVSSACMDSTERGNKSKVVDHFRKSIEILVDHGADPNLSNFNGDNVNDLLQDYNIGEMSMLVANKLTSRNISNTQISTNTITSEPVMLLKGKDGKVQKIEKPKRTPKSANATRKSQKTEYPKISPKKPLIIKSETITGKTVSSVTTVSPVMTDKMKVQSFKLDKPLILKTVMSQNKRKIEMTVGPSNKKSNTND